MFLVQSFYSATIYLWYQVNRDYITRVFCVNKNRPQLKCNGQCYLAKQMREADEKNPPQQLKEWVQVAPFVMDATEAVIPSPLAKRDWPSRLIQAMGRDPLSSIFRPPLS